MDDLQSGRIEVLIPTLEDKTTQRMSPRLTTLDGKVIGLLAHGKPHNEDLLRMIADKLATKYKIKGIIRERKTYSNNPAPKEILDKLAQSCDAVITGIGD